MQRATEAANYVATTVDPYVPAVAKNTAGYVVDSASKAISFGQQKMHDAVEYGKVIVTGATTTLTAYTPGPVLSVINSAVAGAKELKEDPVGTVKNLVPTFVIHAGEKTYEVAAATADSTKKNVEATSGFIITRVNGIVTSVKNVPVIHSVIEQLQQLIEKKTPGSPVKEELSPEEQEKTSPISPIPGK